MREHASTAWIVSIAILITGALLLAGLVLRPIPVHRPFDLPVQMVQNELPSYTTPAAHLGDPIHVTATKCNHNSTTTPDQGTSYWVEVDPPGFTYQSQTGVSSLKAGCTEFNYLNSEPAAVIARAQITKGATVWKIDGTTTALEPHASTQFWTTVTFTLVP